MLTKPLAIVLTVCVGMILALQPAINAEVSRRMASGAGAVMFSLTISLAVMFIYLAATRPSVDIQGIWSAPWWVWASGVIGALFLITGLTATPVLGAALFFMCLVIGQLFGATIADHFGLVGLENRIFSTKQLIGTLFVLTGVIIATYK